MTIQSRPNQGTDIVITTPRQLPASHPPGEGADG
jgi:hypothetical protein